MAHKFTLNNESLKRKFAAYVVVAKGKSDTKIYVGKTGDNREGCNPIISRCGNHFSYNNIHSQIRNKIRDHEDHKYTYIFEHFDDYYEDFAKRRMAIDEINEIERLLNQRVQSVIKDLTNCKILNPHHGIVAGLAVDKQRRKRFQSKKNEQKIKSIVKCMLSEIRNRK